ncbi:two-component regulator propeller domain-containing protein [Mucilaginibacter antarcticus]|uniref:two-component regulator propeller domain-containing protein n=1 Tax=Mucilaginibacter antarcticus TaxID=1855725 RepID=UPI00362F1CD9
MRKTSNYPHVYTLLLMFALYVPCQAQNKETKELTATQGPKALVRTIKQDSKGNIWLATVKGIFRSDGKLFTNITGKVSSARFYAVLEDRKGNFGLALLVRAFIITMGNLSKITTPNRALPAMLLLVFMKIRLGISGSVPMPGPVATMAKFSKPLK